MTSERKAYIIIIASTIGAMAAFGQAIEHWTISAILGMVAVMCSSLVNGISKSPRDARISDNSATVTVEGGTQTDVTTRVSA